MPNNDPVANNPFLISFFPFKSVLKAWSANAFNSTSTLGVLRSSHRASKIFDGGLKAWFSSALIFSNSLSDLYKRSSVLRACSIAVLVQFKGWR